jgi:succinate dehydrogenase / fumarate reductase membrane anchor subunit
MTRPMSGLRAWLLQRASAVFLSLFGLWVLGYFLTAPPSDFAEWRAVMSAPLVSGGVLLGLLALLLHAWIGLRDVLLDYVRSLPLRLALVSLVVAGLAACGLWGVRLLLVDVVVA